MSTIERKKDITELILSLNDLFSLEANELAADEYYETKFSEEQIEAIKLISHVILHIARTSGVKSRVRSEAEWLSDQILNFAWFLETEIDNKIEEE